MGILIFLLPRRLAFLPIVITACYITLGQEILISVFHFPAMRLIILFAWLRLIVRGEVSALRLNRIDKAIICWVISGFVIYNLQWQTSDALVYRLGVVYNAIGIYFAFRFFIRNFNDVEIILKVLSIVIIPVAIAMLYEHSTGRNIFSVFGGVEEISGMREGRFRSQGAFRHPILAGTFGATLVPMLIAAWFKGKNFRPFAAAGVISGTIIMVTSFSSGPLITYISGLVGLFIWSFRKHMRAIRWGILFTLISLHMVMKAPVWFLISRIADLLGGSGWHRSYLIEQAIAHFGEWWLLGMRYTADWFPYGLAISSTATDITNQYIAEGIMGGLITLILFIVVIISCFKTVGLSLKAMEENPFAEKIIVWSLGASLFAHVIALTGIGYFDQIIVIWYLLLAMISAVGDSFNVQIGMRISSSGAKSPLQNLA